jgi:hypothetical protein
MPEKKRETIVVDYLDIPNDDRLLSVLIVIGDIKQTGTTTIKIANDPSFDPQTIIGSFTSPLPIKACKNMDGKKILITSVVTDTNKDPDNNRTEATLKLLVGDKVTYKKLLYSDVLHEGDTEKFIFDLNFYTL